MYFWGWHILQDAAWDTGVGRSSSIWPNSGILTENPLAGLAGQKNYILGNVHHFLVESTKYIC